MESELWNLTVKNNDLDAYTQRYQELSMLCTKMVPEEEDRVEKFIGGLPDNIQGNGYAVKNVENKRRLEVNQRDNCGQQPPFKMPIVRGQNLARAYTAGNNERKTQIDRSLSNTSGNSIIRKGHALCDDEEVAKRVGHLNPSTVKAADSTTKSQSREVK
ncbi:hypothetical protein Tco_1149110 [Tanacetum coccineum]